MIRVMQLLKSFNIESGGGGTERFAIALAKNLNPERFEVSICGLWDYGSASEAERIAQLNAEGIPAFTAARWDDRHPYKNMWLSGFGLRSAIARQPVDIVNAHSEFADVGLLYLWNLRHAPKLMRTMHYPHRVEWIRRPLRRYLFSYFLFPLMLDLELGVSQRLVDNLDRRLVARWLHKKARLAYNAIDTQRFANVQINRAEKRQSLGIPADAFLIGNVGRIIPHKGVEHLVTAAQSILASNPNAYFLIIGDGESLPQLKEQATQQGNASHILFTGGRTDVEELLACMDLFVSPSFWEGLPTVILESMACGVPVVATRIPGTTDLIQHEVNGWLTRPGDSSELAQVIQAAIENPVLRQEYARSARQVLTTFSINAIAAEYEQLYSAAIGSS